MRHAITILFVSSMAMSAWAWPRVGDDAHYSIVTTGAPIPMGGTLELAVSSIDQTRDQITLRMSATIDGYNQTQNQNDKLSTWANLSQSIPDKLANCSKNGGAAEQVSTPAGNYLTCKISSFDGKNNIVTWYADVVFGFAKQVIFNPKANTTDTIILQSFTNGH